MKENFYKKECRKISCFNLPGKKMGMNGGNIYFGKCNDYLCYEMRRGLVFVGGKCGSIHVII